MTQQPGGLSEWLEFLGQADIPVLKSTARALARLRADEALLNARSVADAVTDDPLVTLKLLRHMQTRKHRNQQYELVDVKQTLLMMGLDTFFREVPMVPLAEDVLGSRPVALVQLLHTARRAQRSAYYAFDWAIRLHDLHAHEVQVSALLTHVAEMLLWCFHPDAMLVIHKRQAADPSLRTSEVQHEVLGFTSMELQRQLTIDWQLPELLMNLMDPAQARSSRVRNVMLAVNLARHSAHGWDDAALPDDYRQIAELLRMDEQKVVALVRAEPAAI